MTSRAETDLAARVVDFLASRRPRAAFVTEIAAAIDRGRGTAMPSLDQALQALEASEQIVSLRESAPDPHLDSFDLRVAALVQGEDAAGEATERARAAAYAVWSEWVREFLAHHRCQ